MARTSAVNQHYGLLEGFDPSGVKGELSPEVASWWDSASTSTGWARSATSRRRTITEPIAIKRPSSGYLIYYDVPERFTGRKFTPSSTESISVPNSKPTTDDIRIRISLMPKLIKEILSNPFRNFTLVKRGDEVFVVERDVDLSNKDLSGADLRRADLRGAVLEGTVLAGADLEGANLEGANLRDADLRHAILRKANLKGTILDGTELNGADLWGANLDPAAPSQATIEGVLSDHDRLHR